MEYYYNYQLIGMHFYWWILWIILIVWVFALPYDIPGQRKKKDSPFDILRRRLAAGEITKEDYQEYKVLLEKDLAK